MFTVLKALGVELTAKPATVHWLDMSKIQLKVTQYNLIALVGWTGNCPPQAAGAAVLVSWPRFRVGRTLQPLSVCG